MIQVAVLVAALAIGVVAQGGFYPAGHVLVIGLALVAALIGGRPAGGRWRWLPWGVLVPAAGLGLWALVRGVAAGADQAALGAAGTVACTASGLVVVTNLTGVQRRWCVQGLLIVGGLVAVTAWAGVAWRIPRYAQLVDHRLWRGSSTVTYPNATAALLAPLAVLAVGLSVGRRARVPDPGAGEPAGFGGRLVLVGVVYLLLVGVGAALSRAGFVDLAVGLVAVAILGGVARTVDRVAPPVVGAVVAVAALAPSFPAGSAPRPLPAAVGLLAGCAIALGACSLRAGRLRWGVLCGLIAGGSLIAYRVGDPGWLRSILDSRGNVNSSGRSGPLRVAWNLVGIRPVGGYGVGVARYIWREPDGRTAVGVYAHDEYLQVLVDLGIVGLVLLLATLVGIAVAARRGDPRRTDLPGSPTDRESGKRQPSAGRSALAQMTRTDRQVRPVTAAGLWTGAVGALCGLAVHSGFDFLWHLAVLPLAGGIFAGLATGEHPSISTEGENA